MFFGRAVTGSDQHTASADLSGELDVQPPIADGERSSGIHAQFLDRPIHEGAPWFAAVARARVLGHAAVRMVRTIVIRVEVRAARREQIGDSAVHPIHHRFREESAGDPRLVRDHDDGDAGVVERANRVGGKRIENDAVGTIEIADLFDQRAVPIEKDRRPAFADIVIRAASSRRGRRPR